MTRSLTLRRLTGNRSIVFAYFGAGLLFVVTSAFSTGFASANHVRILLIQASFIGIVALGQTFVILGGGIDLSIPWTLNGAAILVTLFADGKNGPLVWAIPLVLAMGALVGVINGVGIAFARRLADHHDVGDERDPLGGAPPLHERIAHRQRACRAIQSLATGRIGPIPADTVLWLALAGLATLVLTWTAFGRHLYALGTNRTVAQFSGIATSRVTVITYVISGTSAALAGIVLTGYVGQAYLGMGDAYLFSSVAAVAIGGASILGGSGHYLGTVAGALILTVLAGVLPILNLDPAALQIIYGIVILVTVAAATIPSREAVTR